MEEKVKKIIFYFILLQPFLDLYWFYHGKLADILPFTLPTIIRIIAVAIILGMFFSQKQKQKIFTKNKWLIAYLVILIIYSIIHLWHVKSFASINPSGYNYSVVSEIFYLIRMAMPLALIYFTNETDFNRDDLRISIEWLSGLFAGTIVISNLFVISLRSYETGFISANIFEWFVNPNIGYSHMASKGFFNFTNMVAAVLLMLLPLMIHYLFENFNWKIATLTSIHALAMIEVGTKVAAIGLIVGIIIGILLYALHRFFFENTKTNNKALLCALAIECISLAILPFGPAIQRYNYEIKLAKESDHDLTNENHQLKVGLDKYPSGKKRKIFLQNFIHENYQAYALNKKFIFKSYPYQYDPEFWLKIMHEPGESRMQNRHLEKAMLDQVVKYNNNKLDKWLGISYTRQTNIFNLERDFISQAYSLGIIGSILFVGPYVIILLYAVYEWLKNKRIRTYLISSLILSVAFALAAAYSSGNVMDFLTATFILAFIEGNLLIQIKRNKKTT